MGSNKNKSFDWRDMNEKASKVLGDDFWDEINSVIPKRGPCIDVYQTSDEVVVVVEASGTVSPDDINVHMAGLKLILSGKIPWIYPVSEEEVLQSERFIGEFKREIQLPHDISLQGNIVARCKNGLVEIHIPKIEKDSSKVIQVKFME